MAVLMSMNGIINVIGKSENEVDTPVVHKIQICCQKQDL